MAGGARAPWDLRTWGLQHPTGWYSAIRCRRYDRRPARKNGLAAGQILGIALLDHIVVDAAGYTSLRKLGFMSPEPRELELKVAA